MKNYCYDLFNGIFIQKTTESTVELGHCCISKLSPPDLERIDPHTEFLEENRKYFIETGELPAACNYCKKAEDSGFWSRRLHHTRQNFSENNFPTEFKLKSIDYNCDNICNLKCIMCSSYYSSSWIDDERALGLKPKIKIKHTKHNNLIQDLDVSEVRRIYFNGGEPLMTRDHLNVLQYIVDNGSARDTQILYSTNGTFPLTDEILEMWTKFSGLDLSCSIDGIGDVFEYVRYPGKWAEVESNLIGFKQLRKFMEGKKLFLNFGSTVGIHNVLYVDQIYAWTQEHGFTMQVQDTNGRNQLSLENFPKRFQPQLLESIDKLPQSHIKDALLKTANSLTNENDTRWVQYLKNLDRVRGNSWKQSLPRLYELDKKYFDSITGNYIGLRSQQ